MPVSPQRSACCPPAAILRRENEPRVRADATGLAYIVIERDGELRHPSMPVRANTVPQAAIGRTSEFTGLRPVSDNFLELPHLGFSPPSTYRVDESLTLRHIKRMQCFILGKGARLRREQSRLVTLVLFRGSTAWSAGTCSSEPEDSTDAIRSARTSRAFSH
jgi:hypothetical protein